MAQLSDADNRPAEYEDEEITGLPLLPTWHSVYWYVVINFMVYVVLLRMLTKGFV